MFLNALGDDWKLLRKASSTLILEGQAFRDRFVLGTELKGTAGPGMGAGACVARFQATPGLGTVSLCVGGTER